MSASRKTLAFSVLLLALCWAVAPLPGFDLAYAAGDSIGSIAAPNDHAASNNLVIDESGTLDPADRAALESRAQDLASTYQVSPYILFVDRIGSQTAREFAKSYYLEHGLGSGSGKSGILFLVAVKSRDYVTITYGDGVNAFTDWQIARMEDTVVPRLSDSEWSRASELFLDGCEQALSFRRENGKPLDKDSDPQTKTVHTLIALAIALVAAGVVAGASCAAEKAKMRNAVVERKAGLYAVQSSINLIGQSDEYVNSTVSAVPIPRHDDNDSGGGWSGGSSFDSSGFGGSSGGKF